MTASTSVLAASQDRLERVVAVIPYVLLALSTLLAWLLSDEPLMARLWTAALAALAALWIWLLASRRPPGPVFVVGLVVLIGVLGWRDVWYAGLFGFAGYLYSWSALPGRWRYVGVAATALVNTAVIVGGPPRGGGEIVVYLALVVATVLLVSLFSAFGDLTVARGTAYRETAARLEEALEQLGRLQGELVEQAREAGVQEERRRLAREVHDTLAQGLAGIVTQLQAAERSVDADDAPALQHHLDTALRLARDGLVDARRSVRAMGPAQLERTSLPDAVAQVARAWQTQHTIAAVATTTGDVRELHPEVEASVVRVAQEALANVGKHSGAARVAVTLSYMEDQVALDVRDDGSGFDTDAPTGANRYGLASMRQRIERLGGYVGIESSAGAGTAVSVILPAIPGPSGESPGGTDA